MINRAVIMLILSLLPINIQAMDLKQKEQKNLLNLSPEENTSLKQILNKKNNKNLNSCNLYNTLSYIAAGGASLATSYYKNMSSDLLGTRTAIIAGSLAAFKITRIGAEIESKNYNGAPESAIGAAFCDVGSLICIGAAGVAICAEDETIINMINNL